MTTYNISENTFNNTMTAEDVIAILDAELVWYKVDKYGDIDVNIETADDTEREYSELRASFQFDEDDGTLVDYWFYYCVEWYDARNEEMQVLCEIDIIG